MSRLVGLGLLFAVTSSQASYIPFFDLPKNNASLPADILMMGQNGLYTNLRYEHVDNNAYETLAELPRYAGRGLTLNVMLDFQTARYYDFFAGVEFNHVSAFLPDHFNSGQNTTPSKVEYADIPDPKGTAMPRLYLGYTGLDDTWILLGRQPIIYDNARFVGEDSFRQTPQTFDAISIVNRSLRNVELAYSYVAQWNTIYQGAPEAYFPTHQNKTHLVNISSQLKPFGTLVGYTYLIADEAVPENSNATYGLRALSELDFLQFQVYWVMEYAQQNQHHNQPTSYKAYYTHFNTGVKGYGVDVSAGQEILSGNRAVNKAFRTPFASKHDFNGLADQFLETPMLGLIDWYGQVKASVWDTTGLIQYHYFDSQRSNAHYGHEWDFQIRQKLFHSFFVDVGYARFSGNPTFHYSDVNKIWASVGAEI